MKTRIPIPIKKLLQDKQDEKLKKQQNNHDKSGPPGQNQIQDQEQVQSQSSQTKKNIDISSHLKENLDNIKKTIGNSSDIVIREFQAGQNGEINIAIIFTDGLTNSAELQDFVLNTQMFEIRNDELDSTGEDRSNLFNLIKTYFFPVAAISVSMIFRSFFSSCYPGIRFFYDGCSQAISISLRQWAERGVRSLLLRPL